MAGDQASGSILVINPNSNEAVTQALDRSLENLRSLVNCTIECSTLDEGPLGIETSRQADEVVGPLCRLIEQKAGAYRAFVVACFSDPGVVAARETVDKPVIGLCEGAVTLALNMKERFGILTNLWDDIGAEQRLLRAQGLQHRLAGIEAIGIPVTALKDEPATESALVDATARLAKAGAEVVILGCAGMSLFSGRIRQKTGLAVIDPVVAAVGLALTASAISELDGF